MTEGRTVLNTAEMKLPFLIPACMELCFGFFTKPVLMAHESSTAEQDSFSVKAFSVFHSTSTVCRLPRGKGLRHRWDSWPGLIKGIFHVIWHNVQQLKLDGSLPKLLLLAGLLGISLLIGHSEWLPLDHLFFCWIFFPQNHKSK